MVTAPGRCRQVVMYEIDPARTAGLLDLCLESSLDLSLRPRDFLADTDPGQFSITVMNPPYEGDQDALFIEHALNHSTAVVGLFRSAFVHGSGRWDRLWRHTDIERMAWLSSRPNFGGEHSAKADFVALHLTRRKQVRLKNAPATCSVEWW